MEWLTAIVYALARGFWSAYFDALRERESAREETVSDADRERTRRFRDAVDRLSRPVAGADASGPKDPAPGGGNHGGGGVGPTP